MYKNVGKKIQTLAKVVAWIGIIFFVLCGAVVLYGGLNTYNYQMIFSGAIMIILCPILCWLGSLMSFGFGKIVETNEASKNRLDSIEEEIKKIKE